MMQKGENKFNKKWKNVSQLGCEVVGKVRLHLHENQIDLETLQAPG